MPPPNSTSTMSHQKSPSAAISNTTDVLIGWQGQPNQRGTINIIWSCILVIFTCVWTVLHINVPAPKDEYWTMIFRKLRWALFAAFAPEMLTLLAACQRLASVASTKYLKSQGYEWTQVHSFYAESGGFYLHVPQEQGYPPYPPFPVNSRAIVYLVEKGYIEIPSKTVTVKDIEDKSKADKFAKVVAVIQTTYLILECIARRIQSLAISPLELTTLAFIPCTLATYFMWMDKPLGVNTSTPIYTTTPLSKILADAGSLAANKQWRDTPLDFIEDHTPMSVLDPSKPQPPAPLKAGRLVGWNFWARRPRFAYVGNLRTRPISRIPNDYNVAPSSYADAVPLWALSTFHAVVHLLGWNFIFPSQTELWMWRVCALFMTGILGVGGLGNVRAAKPYDFRFQMLGVWVKPAFKEGAFWKYGMDAPGTICAILYFIAKIWIIALSWASLRALPQTAYQTVTWTRFWPHV